MAIKRKFPYRIATVYCNGGCHAKKKVDYQAASCEEAMALCEDGPLVCSYGCLGCGSCVSVCQFDAIHINENGVAEVDEEQCIGCGACAVKCPRNVIHLRIQENSMVPLCSNEEKGVYASKSCSNACIGCHKCEKFCPADAIHVENNRAVIDEEKCLSCGRCVTVCPKHVIVDKQGIILA